MQKNRWATGVCIGLKTVVVTSLMNKNRLKIFSHPHKTRRSSVSSSRRRRSTDQSLRDAIEESSKRDSWVIDRQPSLDLF